MPRGKLSSCGRYPTSLRTLVRSASVPVASWPSTWIDPAVGGITVESSRMSVVLPAPFGPSSPVTP